MSEIHLSHSIPFSSHLFYPLSVMPGPPLWGNAQCFSHGVVSQTRENYASNIVPQLVPPASGLSKAEKNNASNIVAGDGPLRIR